MAEYNKQYLSIKHRLSVLKLLTESDSRMANLQKDAKLKCIDALLKILDDRYSDGLYLDQIDGEVSKYEKNVVTV